MKHIFLFRHADSAEQVLGQSDFKRPITNEGIAEVYKVCKFIKKMRSFSINHWIVSGATRTIQTCQVCQEVFGQDGDQILGHKSLYDGSVSDYFDCFAGLDGGDTLFFFGHNPSVSYYAQHFFPNTNHITTGSVIYCTSNVTDWADVNKHNMNAIAIISPSMI